MKIIKDWLSVVALILTICGGLYGYGRLNEKVENNSANIHRNERIIINQMDIVGRELKIIREDCSVMRGDIREVKGFLKGREK